MVDAEQAGRAQGAAEGAPAWSELLQRDAMPAMDCAGPGPAVGDLGAGYLSLAASAARQPLASLAQRRLNTSTNNRCFRMPQAVIVLSDSDDDV
jgi:hypothetical protein